LINGVLWFGGVPLQPNLVWGSALGGPENLPVYNEFNLSKPVTGLGLIGDDVQGALVVGFNEGHSIISGVGPGNFFIQDIPSEDGVAAGRSMVTVAGVLYYIGNTAIYRYDGSVPTPISTKVEPWILNDPLYPDFPMNGTRSQSWAFFYNQKIYFVYDSGPSGSPNTALVWDIRRQGWTIYSPFKFYAACLMDAPGDPDPPALVAIGATSGQVYNLDTYTLAAPTPSTTTVAGGALGSRTYFIRNTYVTALGESIISSEVSQVVAASHLLVVNSPATTGQSSGWNTYVSTTAGAETRQNGGTPIALGAAFTEPTSGLVTGAALPTVNPHQIDDAGTVISSVATTKYFKIGDPGTPKVLMRLYPELFLESWGGSVVVITDYGSSASSQIVVVQNTQGALWDVALWDASVWAGGAPRTFVKQRLDFNLQGEAFAFSITTSDTNPTYAIQGFSGSFVQEARS
jgi:hypothetical protein